MGGGSQESINNHRTMTAGDDEQCEHAADVEGSNKEDEGGKGNDE